MGLFDFLKPIEEGAGEAAHGVFNFLKPVGQAAVSLGETGAKIGGIGVEDARAVAGLATGNNAATKAALQRGKSDINTAIGVAQSLPRGIAQLYQSAVNKPTVKASGTFQRILFGDQPVQSLQQAYRTTQAQTGSTAQAAGSTLLSFLSDAASVIPLAEGAKAIGADFAENAPKIAASEVGAIGKDVNPTTDVKIPVGDQGFLRVTQDELKNLSNAKSTDDVKNIIGDALPQNIVDRVAPSIAITKDPNTIVSILDRATPAPTPVAQPVATPISDITSASSPTRDISQIPEGQVQQPNLADIQQADVNGRPNGALQTQIESAHNAGDTAKVSDLIKQLPPEDQASMRSALGIQDVKVPTITGAESTKPVATQLSPELQSAVDLATKPTDVGTVDINPSGKIKQLAGNIRTAFSGEKGAQIQAGNVLADTLKKFAPGEEDAITWYREAKGDQATLESWLNKPNLEAYHQDIQDALNLSPQGKEVSAALDQVYAKAGANAYDKGTLTQVLNDYSNPRIYQQPDKQPNTVSSVLRQTTNSSKHRVFDNLPEAIDNGHFPATTNSADLAAVHLADLAHANATNSLLKGLVDTGLGTSIHSGEALPEGTVDIGGLRAVARDEKNARIDLYSQAKDLRPIQSKAESLISTRQSWVRKLTNEIDRLNKQGLDISLSKTKEDVQTGNAFKYLEKDVLTNAETTAKTRDIHDIGTPQSITGQLKTVLTPGKEASIAETRRLVNDLVNLPEGKIEAIKSKIATRENKLGPILDNINNLKDQIDSVKVQRQNILEEAHGINSPTRVVVPEQLAKGLRAITEPDFVRRVDGYRSIAAYQGLVKTVDLSFSLFHHITEAAQLFYQTKGGIDILRHSDEVMNSVSSPEFARLENNFVKYGGTTTKVADTQDVMRNLIGTDQGLYGKLTNAPGVKQVLGVAEKSSSLLFDKAQRWLKVSDFQSKLSSWIEKHPEATPQDFQSAATGYAKEINAAYGGLNWEAIGVTKTAQSVMRGLLLAPDWVVSNLELGKYALTKGFTDTAGNAARAHLLTAFSTGLAATEVLNKTITGHFTNQNPQGHKWEVEIAPNVYVSVFRGGIGDILKLASNIQDKGIASGTAQFAQGKLSPLARTAVGLASGTQFTGQPITNKNDNFAQKTVAEGKFLATSLLPVPFGVSSTLKYANDAIKSKQRINPLVAATLGAGISRFTKSNNGLSTNQQTSISNLAKQGASKQEQDANVQFYLTLKKTASDRTKADTAITQALAKNDINGAMQAAAAYNQKLAGSFGGWVKQYGGYSNSALTKAYRSNKINLTTDSINARIKSIKNSPLYSATIGGN